ncbi:MAG TPA: hypothetical protein VEU96_11715 [Bryobacteraceae bacterium]|nr:hypothetical protein [Bryobacteraceae bacterium]
MPDLSTHKTKELPASAKEALEKLLGRQLADDEEVSIWASRPHSAPTGAVRKQAWRQLNDHRDRLAEKTSGSAEELERLVDEVSDQVRHGPR